MTEETVAYMRRLQRFNQSQEWKRAVYQLIVSAIPHWPKKILDVGCGSGQMCQKLRAYFSEAEVWGCDAECWLVKEARTLVPSAAFSWAYADHLPFAAGVFDWLTCIHVISHVERPDMVLREMHRVLRPGGRVSFVVPNLLFDVLMIPHNLRTGYKGDSTIRHHWTPGMFMRALKKAGFSHSYVLMTGEQCKLFPNSNRTKAWFICEAMK